MDFEELVDMALAFLEEDLRAERALVVHPDPGGRESLVQGHLGFTSQGLAEIETIRWEFQTRPQGFLVEWAQGRSQVGCPLPGGGLLYADHSAARFQAAHRTALEEFALAYADALSELATAPAPEALLRAFPNLARDERDCPVPERLLLIDWL